MLATVARVAGGLACALLLASAAVAATPITNGIYTDPAQGVSVTLAGKNLATPQVKCHGTMWVPTRGVNVSSSGFFSYSGKAAKVAGHHPPIATKTKLTISGTFKTAHLVTGKAKVDGCSVTYRAKFRFAHP